MVAGAALLIVYLGLTYLGVTTSRFFDLTVPRTFLVSSIVRNLLGNPGILLFSVVVALACITTAVALVSSAAAYFAKLSGGRLSYKVLVAMICVFSAVVSNIGLDQIVSVAAPILSIVYPPTLTLILISFLNRLLRHNWIYRGAVLGALAASLLTVGADYGLPFVFIKALPLAALGFNWVLPAVAGGILGALLGRLRPSTTA